MYSTCLFESGIVFHGKHIAIELDYRSFVFIWIGARW